MKKFLALLGMLAITGCDHPTGPAISKEIVPPKEIASLEVFDELILPYGAAPIYPSIARASFRNAPNEVIPIEWTGFADPLTPGRYRMEGKPILDEALSNPAAIKTSISLFYQAADSTVHSDSAGLANFGEGYNNQDLAAPAGCLDLDSMTYSIRSINSTEYSYRVITNDEEHASALAQFGLQLDSTWKGWGPVRTPNEIEVVILLEHRIATYSLNDSGKPVPLKKQYRGVDSSLFKIYCGNQYVHTLTLGYRGASRFLLQAVNPDERDSLANQLRANLRPFVALSPMTVKYQTPGAFISSSFRNAPITFDLNAPDNEEMRFDSLVTLAKTDKTDSVAYQGHYYLKFKSY